MDQKTRRHDPQRLENECDRIERDRWIAVQRMKADAATLRVEDWICQQMIKIHRHRRQHDEPGEAPARAKETPGHKARQQQVGCHM